MESITLEGKLIITGRIRAVTGLHIGGAGTALEIGGVDNIVIRNPITNYPCIPGSSLKGKMRSLMERCLGLKLTRQIGPQVRIHECDDKENYQGCDVCQVFGVAGEREFATPTRLIVRDVALSDKSAEELEALETDYPYTEVKWEAAIDRITSAAVPRQFERVPAGTTFEPLEMVFNFYGGDSPGLLLRLFEAMELLEDDYLGGMGSRGYGKIAFENITLSLKTGTYYETPDAKPKILREGITPQDLRTEGEAIIKEIQTELAKEY